MGHRFFLSILGIGMISCQVLAAADLAPVLIKKTDLNSSVPKTGVLLDMADVELTVDQKGAPFSLKSSIGLPEYVVNSLEGWRWSPYVKNKQSVAFLIKMTIPVARKITPDTEKNLGVFWYPPSGEANNTIKRGHDLTKVASQALEETLSAGNDACDERTSLLVYYAGESAEIPEEARTARARLLTWLVEHEPQCDILGSPFALVNASGDSLADADTAAKLTASWLDAVNQHTDDSKVILHALNFLQAIHPVTAMQVLAAHYNKKTSTTEWAGRIDALSAIGVTALDRTTGRAIAADDAASTGSFAHSARDELLHSDSSKMVLTGLTTLTSAGRSLSARHQLPAVFSEFCSSLLVRAKTFYPETKQSCDASTQVNEDVVPLPVVDEKLIQAKLTKKVVPIYPAEAKNRRLTGTVLLSVIVNKTGDTVELGLTSGPFLLYHSALDAVKDWKYSPTKIGGEPVDISTVVTVHYTLMN